MEDDLTWLTESLKTEQKLVMKGNNIEDNRLKFLKEKGMEGWNSEENSEAVPENLKGRMTLRSTPCENTSNVSSNSVMTF